MTNWIRRVGIPLIVLCAIYPLVGCERDVMEVETPSGEVEVEENLGGGLEVESD